MIELSSVFQQYVVEYMLTQPGTSQEEKWFSKIIDGFGLAIEADSRVISRPFLAQFLSIVFYRNNKNHITRVVHQIAKRTEVASPTDIAEPMVNLLTEGFVLLNNSMTTKFRKLRISFPVYMTNCSSTNSLVNPYEEFIYWAVDTYYDSIEVADRSAEFVHETGNKYLCNLLKDTFDNDQDVVVSNYSDLDNNIPILDDCENVLCYASVASSQFAVMDSQNGEKRYTFYVDFRKNPAFDYLFDNSVPADNSSDSAPSGSVFYINDIPGLCNQFRMLCCVLKGFANFSTFKRVHKKNSGIMSGIQSYCDSVFNFGGTHNISFGYDEAYVTYRTEEGVTSTCIVSYKGYVNDIDSFVTKLTK